MILYNKMFSIQVILFALHYNYICGFIWVPILPSVLNNNNVLHNRNHNDTLLLLKLNSDEIWADGELPWIFDTENKKND